MFQLLQMNFICKTDQLVVRVAVLQKKTITKPVRKLNVSMVSFLRSLYMYFICLLLPPDF